MLVSVVKVTLGPLHCFPRPVARMLAKSRQSVENCTFAGVGIAGQGYSQPQELVLRHGTVPAALFTACKV
jgi:hypothetical protein